MKLLLDQDVYALTARFLIDAGHDVVLAAESVSWQIYEALLAKLEDNSHYRVT